MSKSSVVILLLSSLSFNAFTTENTIPDSWQSVEPQTIDSSYHRDFAYRHNKGFYLAASFGPQWNQSLQNPAAGAFRFGGKFSIGWIATENLAIHANVWGNFLEQSSLVAAGPGVTYFFGDSNIGLGAAIGVGQVFSTSATNMEKFRETVLAGELSLGKYWWLSEKVSLGTSLVTGMHGFTLSNASLSSVGWHAGLRLELVYN